MPISYTDNTIFRSSKMKSVQTIFDSNYFFKNLILQKIILFGLESGDERVPTTRLPNG